MSDDATSRISIPRPGKTSVIAGGAVVVAAAVATASLALTHGGTSAASVAAKAAKAEKAASARLLDSSCGGPAGAAYVAEAGYDAFAAINTANCDIIQSYNVGDPQVPGDPGDYDYASTSEAVAVHGSTLYFADTGVSEVSVIDSATLNPDNYSPAETDIHVGLDPQDLAVTPDGSQLWVAATGPQTSPSSPTEVNVVDTSTDKVIAAFHADGSPSQIAFSPSGATAYVVTSDGLYSYSTTTRKLTGYAGDLGDPRGIAVSPSGATLYVTDTDGNSVKAISASTGKVTATIGVGELPWQIVISSDGKTAYVADPDSDAVSVIDTATDKVTDTISINGDPDTLALTPDGSQLWVGQNATGYLTVVDTSGNSVVGSINLGGSGPQSGDGLEPTGIALVSTPTPGS
jgi:YVTN family beta-propeller protein